MNQDTRRLDLHNFGLEVKKRREERRMTQEALAQMINRGARTVMQLENQGQHIALNVFYQIATMFEISVDRFFYPQKFADKSACRTRIDMMLDGLDESDLRVVEATAKALKDAKTDRKQG